IPRLERRAPGQIYLGTVGTHFFPGADNTEAPAFAAVSVCQADLNSDGDWMLSLPQGVCTHVLSLVSGVAGLGRGGGDRPESGEVDSATGRDGPGLAAGRGSGVAAGPPGGAA